MQTKVVCFDLDDTLIREVHSVMLPCILNGQAEAHDRIQSREELGEIDYITADYERVKLLEGLQETRIEEAFLTLAKPLKRIAETVQVLQKNGIQCLVITVGPVQVAKVVSQLWGFDAYYGSHYEVIDGKFTGQILNYLRADQKVDCLQAYCSEHGIMPEACIAVGDGATDIPVFEYCGKSIAINSSEKVKRMATYAVETDDLYELLPCLL